MYSKPELVKYGTFREMTLVGFGSDGDGFSIGFLDNCGGPFATPCEDDRS